MKAILISMFSAILLIGCENKKQEDVVIGKVPPKEVGDLKPSLHCYLFTNGKDSISISYTQEKDEVEGWMNYNFFEKDGSIGEIEGKFVGDTLKLEYEFMSEGMFSEQEVFFLKKDGKLYRGAGDVKNTNDSTVIYANPKQIKYDDTTPLSHQESCAENFIKKESIDLYKNALGNRS